MSLVLKPRPGKLRKRLLTRGSGEILLVCDPRIQNPDQAEVDRPLGGNHSRLVGEIADQVGLDKSKLASMSCAHPVTPEVWDRDSVLNKTVAGDRYDFIQEIKTLRPRLVVAMGKCAARQVLGRAVKITKCRGTPVWSEEFGCIVLPTLSPAHVSRMPEHRDTCMSDFDTVRRICEAGYSLDYTQRVDIDYEWCFDLRKFLPAIRKSGIIAVDCEWTSYGKDLANSWYSPEMKVMTVQICWAPGKAISIPINYGPWKFLRKRLRRQLKSLLEDPAIRKVGFNFKGDWLVLKHKLGIETKNWTDDGLLMVHAIDENMLNKSQNDAVRRWVPAMSGYNDPFDTDPEHAGKTRMDLLSLDKMLAYGCGDADANLRLVFELERILKLDEKSYNCYRRVPMAAQEAFCDLEEEGFTICVDALRDFERFMEDRLYGRQGDYRKLFRMIHPGIRKDHKKLGQRLKLNLPALIRAFLFTDPRGLKLTPKVFTKTTTKLKDEERIPSVSVKAHLSFFAGTSKFIDGYLDFARDAHLLDTVKNFYKYIYNPFTGADGREYGKIHPSYLLHGTVTGRASSKNPNGQNFPKRGQGARKAIVKAFRSIFVAPFDHVLIEADYSQIELRLVAIASKCKAMLEIYRRGGDIHCLTAANIMGVTLEEFMKFKVTDPAIWEYKRFAAKAVNFGYIYGMWWRKFIIYAKTEYGIDYTDEEAKTIRENYFMGFPELLPWQQAYKDFARRHGYVRAPDGRKRHLPSVGSDDDNIAAGAERQGINAPIQGFGSDLGLMAIACLHRYVPKDLLRVCGFIHDAIVAVAPKARAIEAARVIKHYMETNPLQEWFDFESPIPILADVSMSDKSLADMQELKHDILSDTNVVSFEDYKVRLEQPSQTFAKPKIKPNPKLKRAA